MKKCILPITLLVLVLIASNAWWAYRVLDAGVSYTYQGASLEESQQALSQALAVIKASSNPGATRTQVIEAAQKAWSSGEPFEKEGYLWVGRLGLRFDRQGHLIEAVAN